MSRCVMGSVTLEHGVECGRVGTGDRSVSQVRLLGRWEDR